MGGRGDVQPHRDRPLSPLAGLAVPLALLLAGPPEDLPPLGIIDFYGLRATTPEAARQAIGMRPGDVLPSSDEAMKSQVEAARRRLETLPGVKAAHLEFVCCEEGRLILYVGIDEGTSSPGPLQAAPDGSVRLPEDIVAAGALFEEALMAAVVRGDAGEDQDAGHALMHDPAGRAVQVRFIAFAARDRERLREVLRNSKDASQRALAAQVLAYAADKAAVAPDLTEATKDPDPGVRNNALRALGVMASARGVWPDGRPILPTAPLLLMLRSPLWTDRNKASFLVLQLTQARDPPLLASLAQGAFDGLVEMARWKALGHAAPSLVILGRIGGLSEDAIARAMEKGDRELVIAAAAKAAGVSAPSAGSSRPRS